MYRWGSISSERTNCLTKYKPSPISTDNRINKHQMCRIHFTRINMMWIPFFGKHHFFKSIIKPFHWCHPIFCHNFSRTPLEATTKCYNWSMILFALRFSQKLQLEIRKTPQKFSLRTCLRCYLLILLKNEKPLPHLYCINVKLNSWS